jgi:hypothetical protein
VTFGAEELTQTVPDPCRHPMAELKALQGHMPQDRDEATGARGNPVIVAAGFESERTIVG